MLSRSNVQPQYIAILRAPIAHSFLLDDKGLYRYSAAKAGADGQRRLNVPPLTTTLVAEFAVDHQSAGAGLHFPHDFMLLIDRDEARILNAGLPARARIMKTELTD